MYNFVNIHKIGDDYLLSSKIAPARLTGIRKNIQMFDLFNFEDRVDMLLQRFEFVGGIQSLNANRIPVQ